MATRQVVEISKSMRALSTGKSRKESMMLAMAECQDWEQYLHPAPLSIALLGELVLISSGKDFRIDINPPQGGFKFIEWAGSFRASLAQVCHEGYDAFKLAHKNMDQIRLDTAIAPSYFKEALQILFEGSQDDIEDLLPISLDAIKCIAENCACRAKQVENAFDKEMKLIAELHEACVNADKQYKDKLSDTTTQIEVEKMKQRQLEEELAEHRAELERFQRSVVDAELKFQEAQKSIPSGQELFLLSFGESLCSGITGYASGMMLGKAGAIMACGTMMTTTVGELCSKGKIVEPRNSVEVGKMKPVQSHDTSILLVYKSSPTILEMMEKIYFMADDEKKFTDDEIEALKFAYMFLESERFSMQKKPSDFVVQNVLTICEKGSSVGKNLHQFRKDGRKDKEILKQIRLEAADVLAMAVAFDQEAKFTTGRLPLEGQSPNLVQSNEEAAKNEKLLNGSTAFGARMFTSSIKVEQASAQLKYAQEMVEQKRKERIHANQLHKEALEKLLKLNVEEMDIESIKETLMEGTNKLADVKKRWHELAMFFQKISDLIETSMHTQMIKFVDGARKTMDKQIEESYTITKFRRDLFYEQAFAAISYIYVVNMLSTSYVDVSKLYIMPPLSSLSSLFTLDPKKEGNAIKSKRRQLNQECQEAQHGIEEMLSKKNNECQQMIKAKLKRFESELNSLLPPLPMEIADSLKESLQCGADRAALQANITTDAKLNEFA